MLASQAEAGRVLVVAGGVDPFEVDVCAGQTGEDAEAEERSLHYEDSPMGKY